MVYLTNHSTYFILRLYGVEHYPPIYIYILPWTEGVDPGENWRPRQTCAITACSEYAR